VDAGTRVGRFMLQELVGHGWKRFGEISWYPANVMASAAFVAGWGYILYQGVVDPLGGINSLWPLFGIANQLLACIALCVATTIIIKMDRARYAWVTLVPLAFVTTVTLTAGIEKVFASDPRLGFLAHASSIAGSATPGVQRLVFNDRLDASLALVFMAVVVMVIAASVWEWFLVLSKRKLPRMSETPFVQTALASGD
jgi:carbon starvation protein